MDAYLADEIRPVSRRAETKFDGEAQHVVMRGGVYQAGLA